MNLIGCKSCLEIVKGTLDHVDPRLMGHGAKVAYLTGQILRLEKRLSANAKTELFLLSLFHDVGAYKTEDINDMVVFESNQSWNHSVYGYLFLKYMSPLKKYVDAVLYHHLPYSEYSNERFCLVKNHTAGLIQLADRAEIASVISEPKECVERILNGRGTKFSPYWVDLFIEAQERWQIIEAVRNGSYRKSFDEVLGEIELSENMRRQFLQMVAYSIDFRSEFTVIHTITTVSVSQVIAKLFGLEEEEEIKIYYGALLHDIGKVETPVSILEKPGRLTDEEMATMRHHVIVTRLLLEGKVDPDIVEISARHHEKLDGSGYPEGLSGNMLTLQQQIVAVADIVSALIRKRSYKEAFDHDKTKNILRDMKERGQLHPDVVDIVIQNFEYILQTSDQNEKEVLKMYSTMRNSYAEIMEKISDGKEHVVFLQK